MTISGLYAIADSRWNPRDSLPALALDFLRGGARVIQLRMKNPSSHGDTWNEDCFNVAREIMGYKRDWDFKFIVNDYVDVAAEVRADGVHVGSNDMPIDEVKARVRPGMIVGYSAHSMEDALGAQADGADYVAFGAIYPTETKGPGHPVQGVDALKNLVSTLKVPVVAIGGINRSNVDEVKATGVDSVAMISALCNAESIADETKWFSEKMKL